MAAIRVNLSLDQDIYKRFLEIAEDNGIKTSTWVTLQMRKFIEKMDEPKKK